MIIDTHCHLDFYKNPLEFARKYEQLGYIIIGVTNLPSYFEQGSKFLTSFKRIRLALGLHPLESDKHTKEELEKFQRLSSMTSYIGEVGLDFSSEGYKTKSKQLYSFQFAMEVISNTNKIVTLHSRRAEKEVFKILSNKKIHNAIFHWYSGPLGLIQDIADAGYYFSVNPAMINSPNGRKIIEKIPLSSLLTETDGPYIEVNGRSVIPEDINLVHDYISTSRGLSKDQSINIIKNNFYKLINTISI